MAETAKGPTERERRAIARALVRGGAAAVREGAYRGIYHVASNSRGERQHTVRVDGASWRCDCEAGLAHRPCWAQAAVYVYRLERAGLRVTGAAPAPQGVEPPKPAPTRRPRKEVALL